MRIFAVDATPTSTAYMEFTREPLGPGAADGGLPFRLVPKNNGRGYPLDETTQGEAELQAALNVCEIVAQESKGETCPTCGLPPGLLIGGDASSPRAARTNGYSCSPRFRERMRPVLKGGRVWLRMVRIPGEVNAGDGPSRRRQATEREIAESAGILEKAYRSLAIEAEGQQAAVKALDVDS